MKPLLLSIFILVSIAAVAQDTSRRMKFSDFPKGDMPPASFKRAESKGLHAYNYYYGVGTDKDYKKARYIALIELGDSTLDATISADAVLMMLYANGFGVKRNFGISLWLARKNIWSSIAELNYRTEHLEHLKETGIDSVFDLCDDITSGTMAGVCGGLALEEQEWKRKKTLDSVTSTWSKEDTIALGKLNKVADEFFDTRTGAEVNLSGTARDAFIEEEYNNLETSFLNGIILARNNKLPVCNAGDFSKADSVLNSVYRKVMAKKIGPYDWGTVTKDSIRHTERKWIVYKEAWVKFVGIACPSVSEYSIETFLTKQRIDELNQFLQ